MIAIQDMKMPNTCTMCWLSNICKVRHGKPSWNGWQNRMEECPLVEIIKCKDCKWNIKGGFCDLYFADRAADEYCSRAERAEE